MAEMFNITCKRDKDRQCTGLQVDMTVVSACVCVSIRLYLIRVHLKEGGHPPTILLWIEVRATALDLHLPLE